MSDEQVEDRVEVADSGLPFAPEEVAVKALPGALAEIDDLGAIRALQAADPRTSAAKHYERRINEIGPTVEPGYDPKQWHDETIYACRNCAFAHGDEAVVRRHVDHYHAVRGDDTKG